MKHIIQALVENRFGVLARVASLFSARGYNITSLAVGETNDSATSCMTIVVNAEDERILEQIKKQLNKLIDVITVIDFTRKDYIDRELVLIKIAADQTSKKVVAKVTKNYKAEVAAKGSDFIILEVCEERHKLEELLGELKAVKIKELIRTGRIQTIQNSID